MKGKALRVMGLALFLSGCHIVPSNSVAEEEAREKLAKIQAEKAREASYQSSKNDFKACVMRVVDDYDDGISDAGTIALAVTGKCGDFYARYADDYSKAESYNEYQYYAIRHEMLQPEAMKSASIGIVLESRASKKNNGNGRSR